MTPAPPNPRVAAKPGTACRTLGRPGGWKRGWRDGAGPYDELKKTGFTLVAVSEDLGDAHRRIEHFRSWEVGSDVMDDAMNHFADRWKYGMGLLREEVQAAGEELIAIATTWEQEETALAVALRSAVTPTTEGA